MNSTTATTITAAAASFVIGLLITILLRLGRGAAEVLSVAFFWAASTHVQHGFVRLWDWC